MAASVEIAVRLTERAVLAPAKWLIKLEMFPPGHAATSIIPMAILGAGCIINTKQYVNAGSTKNWESIPSNGDFGFLKTLRKSSTVKFKATPNIMMANDRFSTHNELVPKSSSTVSSGLPKVF